MAPVLGAKFVLWSQPNAGFIERAPKPPYAPQGRSIRCFGKAPIRGDDARAKEDEPDGGAETMQGTGQRLAVLSQVEGPEIPLAPDAPGHRSLSCRLSGPYP